MSAVEIRPVSGIAVEPWLDELADLRIRIFRDYPYLYDGSVERELSPSSVEELAAPWARRGA